jgi:hypothetical protein
MKRARGVISAGPPSTRRPGTTERPAPLLDLHLGVKGDAIPARVRQIGESFNTVLAYRDPTQKIVYDNYMVVRANLSFLKAWINERLADLTNGKTADPF